ncbi:MAG: cell division protein FtsL [Eubacteriales bacterium]|nr:cell division protein FtsL [Eubacteriales bacterium]
MSTARRPEYNQRRTKYVTEGNTVRVVHTEVDPFYEREAKRRYNMERQRERERREAEARKIARARSITLPMFAIIIAAIGVSVFFGFKYLTLRNSVDTHLASIRNLETNLERIRTENDALEQSIDTSVDLTYVYSVAVNKLGMVHAGQENIIEFEKTESEYVRQYEQIPEL